MTSTSIRRHKPLSSIGVALLLAVAGGFGTSYTKPARAQFVCANCSTIVQQLLEYVQQLMQYAKQVQQYELQFKQWENMVKSNQFSKKSFQRRPTVF